MSDTPKILVLDRGETIAQHVEGVAADVRDAPQVVLCPRVGSVAEVLEQEGPFDVLVAGPSLGTRSGLARLKVIHEELPGMSLVLAFSRRPDASLRDIVRTGAIDLLQLPVEDKDLVEALDRALQLSRPAVAAPAAVAAPVAAPHGGPGRVFTISSATGGCGKTFFATNLAYFLQKHTGQRACILDLDLQFGEVSTALRLRPRYTIFDALQREAVHPDYGDDADLQAHIEEYMVVHESGVHVLAAPREPSEADRISPPDVTRVIDAARGRFDFVVIDTPPALTETVLAAFDLSDQLYVMATLDLPSVRNMSVFLGTLERLKVPADNVRLILNKAESDVGIDVAQVTKLFPQGFEQILPYAKEVSRSINVGMPVMASSPGAEISRRMSRGMTGLLPEGARPGAETGDDAPRHGLLRRMFRARTVDAVFEGVPR